MTPEEIKAICIQRLGSWTSRLTENHATPVVLVGVGHDHKGGQVVICTAEEMSRKDIIAFLAVTVNKLVKQERQRN